MTDAEYTHKLGLLKIAESGKIGGLKGTVAALLIRADVGLEMTPADWARLRAALNEAETANKAVIDHLCEPINA